MDEVSASHSNRMHWSFCGVSAPSCVSKTSTWSSHVQISKVFLTSGGVRWGVSYGEKKTGPGPCFVNVDVEDFGGWNFDVLGGLPGFPEVGNLKVF